MSFWQILGRFAVSDTGETLQRVSDNYPIPEWFGQADHP